MHITNYNQVVSTHSGQTCHSPTPSSPMSGAKKDCHGVALTGNKEPHSRFLTPPRPGGMVRRIGRKR